MLAKGLSEKGLLLADITAPPEGCQNASKELQQASEQNTLIDTTLYRLAATFVILECSNKNNCTVQPRFEKYGSDCNY